MQCEPHPKFAVLNADDPYFDFWKTRAGASHVISFGLGDDADVHAVNVRVTPDGSQVVTISYLGYHDQEVTVSISDGQTETIDISLEVMSVQGEEVVITAQAYGQRAAINQQLAANTVVNVVSSEKIEEFTLVEDFQAAVWFIIEI